MLEIDRRFSRKSEILLADLIAIHKFLTMFGMWEGFLTMLKASKTLLISSIMCKKHKKL